MEHEIIRDLYVFDGRPWRGTWISRRKDDCKSVLIIRPVVFENVAVQNHIPCILQFKKILYDPVRTLIAWIIRLPAKRFEKMVIPNPNVGRDKSWNGWITAAEHNVFTRGFEIIVFDDKGSGTIPCLERLRVTAGLLEVRNVGIVDLDVYPIHSDSAP